MSNRRETFIVEVRDNGTGIPVETQPKLLSSHINHSSPGTVMKEEQD
jgi:signal transduction histidine kinase